MAEKKPITYVSYMIITLAGEQKISNCNFEGVIGKDFTGYDVKMDAIKTHGEVQGFIPLGSIEFEDQTSMRLFFSPVEPEKKGKIIDQ